MFNRHWLYFCLVSSAASRSFSEFSQSVVAWSGREKLWPFFPLNKLPHNQDKKMCICKLAMAERFDERLNWFHQTWHGSPPTCDRKLMAPKKWRIHHFSRANMVSGYFSLLTQLFAWQPSVSVQVVSWSLVRANFLLCACTWKLSWFNQDRHDKPLAVTQQNVSAGNPPQEPNNKFQSFSIFF